MEYMERIGHAERMDRTAQDRPFATILGSGLAFGALTGIEVGAGLGAALLGALSDLNPGALFFGALAGAFVGQIIGLINGLIGGLMLASWAKRLTLKGARWVGALSAVPLSLPGLAAHSRIGLGFVIGTFALTAPFSIWRAPRVLYGKKPRESADPALAPNLPDSDWQDEAEPADRIPSDPWDAIPSDAARGAHDPSGS